MTHQSMRGDSGAGDPPDSRDYVHATCGQTTTISGHVFTRLANPFDRVGETFCAGCELPVPLSEVAWADTGERIATYRSRMLRAAPLGVKVVCFAVLPLLFAGVGLGVGMWFGLGNPEKTAGLIAVGVVAGVAVYWWVLMPIVALKLLGQDHRATR